MGCPSVAETGGEKLKGEIVRENKSGGICPVAGGGISGSLSQSETRAPGHTS